MMGRGNGVSSQSNRAMRPAMSTHTLKVQRSIIAAVVRARRSSRWALSNEAYGFAKELNDGERDQVRGVRERRQIDK